MRQAGGRNRLIIAAKTGRTSARRFVSVTRAPRKIHAPPFVDELATRARGVAKMDSLYKREARHPPLFSVLPHSRSRRAAGWIWKIGLKLTALWPTGRELLGVDSRSILVTLVNG
jgi:hypothetical protein